MSELSRSTRALLDAASQADCAPSAARNRGRQRLVRTIATGGIAASAIAAKGALGATSTSASLATTWFAAVAVGLSTGLIALSPANHEPQAPRIEATSPHARLASSARTPVSHRPGAQVLTNNDGLEREHDAASPIQQLPNVAPVATQAVVAGVSSSWHREGNHAPNDALVDDRAPAPRPAEDAVAPNSDVSAPAPTTKASIAHETELLAQAQQALKNGRALLAISILDRYAEECPRRTLDEEATAARVVALCALRRYEESHRLTETFSRHYPNSPLTARVKNACPAAVGTPKH